MLTLSTRWRKLFVNFGSLEKQKEPRRKLRDTKVGQWLKSSAPHLLDAVGNALPDSGVLGIVKNLVDLDNNVTHEQRMELHNLIVSERIAMEAELTKRWESDNNADSWLAKHTRPMIVLSPGHRLVCVHGPLTPWKLPLRFGNAWVTLYEILIVTAVGGYFTLRSVFDKRNNSM